MIYIFGIGYYNIIIVCNTKIYYYYYYCYKITYMQKCYSKKKIILFKIIEKKYIVNI